MILRILFDSLWQGAAIVAIASLAIRGVSRGNAPTRYAVWFAAALALVAVPVVSALSNAGTLLAAAVGPKVASGAWTYSLVPAQSLALDARGWLSPMLPWIAAAWAAGAAIGLTRLAASVARIARLRKDATPLESTRPDVLASPDVPVPVAVGFFRPAILIPNALAHTLGPADLERIVAHERAHVARRDVAGNLVQRLIEAVLFFNPWVYVVGRNLALEREAACDAWAVGSTGNADAYVALLASLARRLSARPVPLAVPSALGSRNALVERIERLTLGAPRRLTPNYAVVGGTVMLWLILTLAFETISPVQAFAPVGGPSTHDAGSTAAVAAACTNPNVDARVIAPARPALPHGSTVKGSAVVLVLVASNGRVARATISRSSGIAQIDRAVLDAARNSTYSPRRVNCKPVEGTYLFRADFAPDGP